MCWFRKKPKTTSEVTDAEIKECLDIIASGRYAHQYYVEHPEFQDAKTGDTALNQLWVSNYDKLKNVITRLRK